MSIRAADMPSANDLMTRVYAAMAQKEGELILWRTRAALAAARARGAVLGGDRAWRSSMLSCAAAAARARQEGVTRTAHRLALEVGGLRTEGITSCKWLARALTERGVATTAVVQSGLPRRWRGSWGASAPNYRSEFAARPHQRRRGHCGRVLAPATG